jgi:hypothetical protein
MRKFGSLDPTQTFERLCQRANALHGCSYRRSRLRSGTEVDYRNAARAPLPVRLAGVQFGRSEKGWRETITPQARIPCTTQGRQV